MLSCPFCAKVFSARGNLNIHLISHTKEKPFKCPTCSAVFGLSPSLKKHIQVVHEGVKPTRGVQEKNWKCSLCTFKCIQKHKLEFHMRKHSTELPFSCHMAGCNFKTKHERSLPQHVQRIHSDDRPHECTSKGCNYKTSDLGNLNRHLKTHSNEKPFKCKQKECKYACKYKSSLELHIYRFHSKEKPFKCSICDFRSKYKDRLRHHEDEHQNIKRFRCPAPNCDYASNSNHHIQLHFSRKHTKKDVNCIEPGCKFTCATSALLKKHIYSRHSLPILKCPFDSCNYSTRMPWDLRVHVSRWHEELDTGSLSMLVAGRSTVQTARQTGAVDPLICPFHNCDYQTEFPHRLDRHVRTHDEKIHKHVCKFCSYRSSSFDYLQKHIQTHTGERPFKCSYCDYAAFSATGLQLHAGRIHNIHVIRPAKKRGQMNKCRTCSREFGSYNEFVLHSMTHLKAVVILQRLELRVM